MATFMYQQQHPLHQASSGPQGEAQQQAAMSLLGMRGSQSNAGYSQPVAPMQHMSQLGVYGYQQYGPFASKPDSNDFSGSGSAASTAQCRPEVRSVYPYPSQYQVMYQPFPATPIELLRQQMSMDHHQQQLLNRGVYGGFHGSMPASVPHLQTAPIDMSTGTTAVDSKPHANSSTASSAGSVGNATTSQADPSQYPFNLPLAYCHNYNRNGRVGIYAPTERKLLLQRFMEKRKKRNWSKVVSYACRKNLAQRRVRIKGRFIKRAADDAHLLANKKKEKEAINETSPKKMSKPASPMEQDVAGPRLVSAH
eukprot:INCI9788.1.p1 GENE.INCI9788.1~~INCI9788.1.p1  ORF type:complete len:309 (+),score=35.49 INCI9788.1:82-1008(+)